MSLTSFLKDEEVKALFEEYFNMPNGKLSANIKAPLLTKKYATIGTAFDYLMRFHLKYHNPDAIDCQWVAENAWELMIIQAEEDIANYTGDDLFEKATSELNFAKDSYKKFLSNGVLTDDILKSSMVLAHLDTYYRNGRDIYAKPMAIDPMDIQDLRNLVNAVDFSKFKAKSHCLLNPTFNDASQLVGGADADIVIDNKLIDIKTTKDLLVKRDMFNQIIGYYILGLMGGIGEQNLDGSTIDKIGFYFSRHGILHLYDVKDIVDFNTLPDFMDKMQSLAEEMFVDEEIGL